MAGSEQCEWSAQFRSALDGRKMIVVRCGEPRSISWAVTALLEKVDWPKDRDTVWITRQQYSVTKGLSHAKVVLPRPNHLRGLCASVLVVELDAGDEAVLYKVAMPLAMNKDVSLVLIYGDPSWHELMNKIVNSDNGCLFDFSPVTFLKYDRRMQTTSQLDAKDAALMEKEPSG